MNWNMTKEEIIKAGLIGLCYGGDSINAFTDADHIKDIPIFDHWFHGEVFEHDFRNIWLIQYDDSGIVGFNFINNP